MIELSLHIMDIVENSVRAGAEVVAISVDADTKADILNISIIDNGRGMSGDELAEAVDPFVTTKPGKKTGLGLSLLRAAARQTGGDLAITSVPGQGTAVDVRFGLTHVDRQPLGNIKELMLLLLVSHPRVEFQLSCSRDGEEFEWDTSTIYERFGAVSRTKPDVMAFVRDQLCSIESIDNQE